MRSQPKACGPSTLLSCTVPKLSLCQSCGRAVRSAHLFVLLTSFSQLLHSAVQLVLCCLPLRLQHVQSSKCAIMAQPRRSATLCPVRMTFAAGWHML